MRYFHKTQNQFWKPIINIDKLWSLVPKEEREGLTEDSEVVPVIDTLHHGYGKVLGNGQYVPPVAVPGLGAESSCRLPKLPFIVKARFVSKIAECVTSVPSYLFSNLHGRRKIKEAGGVVKLIA
jgi:large subunit ribosomal protein L27Ae